MSEKKSVEKTVVSVKPDADRPLSQAEVAHRQDFAQAASWAKAALQDEELRPFYEALGKQRDIPARAAAVEVDADTDYWMYTAQSTIPAGATVAINVKVSDRPGNMVEVTEEKAF